MPCSRRKSGFTIVELMITVMVVGILASIAVPVMRAQTAKAIATEGTTLANAIRTAERVWRSEHDTYTDTWSDIENQLDISQNRFFSTAPTISAGGSTFRATIVGSGDAAGISVTIDDAGIIEIAGLE